MTTEAKIERRMFLMRTKKVEHMVKSSIVYGYAVTQPFLFYGHSDAATSDISDQSSIWKNNSKIVRHIQETSSDKDHPTVAYPLLKEKTDKGVKSSHQIKVDGKENKQEMQENLAVEKKQHFEKVHSDLSSIEYGETSEHVENVQEALAFYDYYEGEIDGIYGTMTETALQEAEQDNALPERIQTEQQTASNEEENDENTASSEEEETNSEENNEETEGTEKKKKKTETAQKEEEQDNAIPERIQTEQQTASNEEENDENTASSEEEETNSEENNEETEGTEQDEEISEEAVSLEVENDSTDVIGHAKELIGTPYEWGGTSPSGFDCSGFIQFVYEKEDKTLPRTVREVWNYGSLVDEPSIGDLVFFETYQAGPSHMGIYLGNGDFIHAGSSEGVTISNI